jgi:hypothetical protein
MERGALVFLTCTDEADEVLNFIDRFWRFHRKLGPERKFQSIQDVLCWADTRLDLQVFAGGIVLGYTACGSTLMTWQVSKWANFRPLKVALSHHELPRARPKIHILV